MQKNDGLKCQFLEIKRTDFVQILSGNSNGDSLTPRISPNLKKRTKLLVSVQNFRHRRGMHQLYVTFEPPIGVILAAINSSVRRNKNDLIK